MLEQIPSSPTESVSAAAAAKGKSGKQGVFTNLFKALEGKGITVGKSGAAAAAQTQGNELKGTDKASGKHGLAGITAKGLKAEAEGEEASGKKITKTAGAELNAQAVALEGMNRANQTHAGKASSGEQQDDEQDGLLNSSRQQTGKGGKQLADDKSQASVKSASGLSHGEQAEKHIKLQNASSPLDSNPVGSNQAASSSVSSNQVGSAPVASSRDQSNPQIGMAQAHASGASEAANKASIEAQAAGRAADKTLVSDQATAKQASTQQEAALLADNTQTRRTAAQPSAKATSAEVSVHKQATQAGAIDHETLQHDADAVQRVREELAGMANKIAAKATQGSYNTKGRSSDAQVAAQSGVAHQQSGNPAAQPINTQTVAGGQASVSAAAVAAETGQQSGQDLGSRQESADSRLMAASATDSKPQQAFDLQQQNAARMAQPMRPLEAMQSIAHSAANGTTRLELQLEPAHLGKIHISLQTDAAKQLQMHLTVESTVTRQVIEQHMPQLRAALEQQGLNLDNFSLHTGSHNQQQQQAFEHAAGTGTNQYPLSGGMENAATNQPAFSSSRLSIHI